MNDSIRVIAICVFRRADSILVSEGFDSIKGTPFYRPLGGGVHRGETSREAVIREIREEIEADVTELKLLGTLENIFRLEDKNGHEIVFVYEGQFEDAATYLKEEFTVREDNGEIHKARWRPLSFFTNYHRLVPDGLTDVISPLRGVRHT